MADIANLTICTASNYLIAVPTTAMPETITPTPYPLPPPPPQKKKKSATEELHMHAELP